MLSGTPLTPAISSGSNFSGAGGSHNALIAAHAASVSPTVITNPKSTTVRQGTVGALSASINSPIVGQSVTFTFTGGTSDSVQFEVDGNTVGARMNLVVVNGVAQATFGISFASAGVHTIGAIDFVNSTGPGVHSALATITELNITVTPAASTTALSTSLNHATVGGKVDIGSVAMLSTSVSWPNVGHWTLTFPGGTSVIAHFEVDGNTDGPRTNMGVIELGVVNGVVPWGGPGAPGRLPAVKFSPFSL